MAYCLTDAFERIAAAMAVAEEAKSCGAAAAAAEQCGLVDLSHGKPTQHTIWERHVGPEVVWFEWRWYDQSQAFSIRPDMNILTVTLMENGNTVRKVECRYED